MSCGFKFHSGSNEPSNNNNKKNSALSFNYFSFNKAIYIYIYIYIYMSYIMSCRFLLMDTGKIINILILEKKNDLLFFLRMLICVN